MRAARRPAGRAAWRAHRADKAATAARRSCLRGTPRAAWEISPARRRRKNSKPPESTPADCAMRARQCWRWDGRKTYWRPGLASAAPADGSKAPRRVFRFQHGDVQTLTIHRLDLANGIVVARHGKIIAIGDLLLAVIDDLADAAQGLAPAQFEFDPAVPAVSPPSGNPLAPFRIHVLFVEIRRVEHMYVAVETPKSVFHVILCFWNGWPLAPRPS